MTEKSDILRKMDNTKLIDIVKNYQRYGYAQSLRDEALQLLKERGIDEETLKLTGNLSDRRYESVEDIFRSFNRSSKTSFIFYGLFIASLLLSPIFPHEGHSTPTLVSLFSILCFIGSLIFIGISLLRYSDFYKALGKHLGAGPYLQFIISGVLTYFVAYFYFKKEMKEEMKMMN
jgi:hypothetical protein